MAVLIPYKKHRPSMQGATLTDIANSWKILNAYRVIRISVAKPADVKKELCLNPPLKTRDWYLDVKKQNLLNY